MREILDFVFWIIHVTFFYMDMKLCREYDEIMKGNKAF